MNEEQKRKRTEIGFLISVILILCVALWFDISGLNCFSFLEAKMTIFVELFTVQATMVTLSAAIVAIISGFATKSYYGISVTKYISSLKPLLFKHRFVIVGCILLTLVNYFLVSYQMYNVSIWIFFISVVASAYITYEIYFVFSGKDKLKESIYKYYVNHYNELGLDYLHQALIKNQDISNKMFFGEDIHLLEDIYYEMIKKNDDFKSINQLMSDIISVLIENKDSTKIIEYIEMVYQIYHQANQSQNKVSLKLWDDISYEFYSALRLVDVTQTNHLLHLHNELFENQSIVIVKNEHNLDNSEERVKIANGYDLDSYGAQLIYAAALNKEDINQRSYYRFLGDVILVISNSIAKSSSFSMNKSTLNQQEIRITEYQQEIRLTELCKAYKALIENHESKIIKEYAFDNYRNDVDDVNVALLVLLIYLYYLKIESLTNEGTRNVVDYIIDENKTRIFVFVSRMEYTFLEKYYWYICDTMRIWELMPEEGAKAIIIDSAINDFIVYMSAFSHKTRTELSNVIRLIFNGGSYSAYVRYSSDKNSDSKERLKSFYSIFHMYIDNNEIENIMTSINNSVSQVCMEEEIANRTKYEITDDDQKAFIENVNISLKKYFGENDYLFDINDSNEYNNSKRIGILRTNLLAGLSSDTKHFDETLEGYILSSVIQSVLYEAQEHIKSIIVSRSSRNKQQTLIKLKEEEGINTDTIIGGRDIFWEENDKSKLSDYCKDYHHISYRNGYNQIYLIDSSKIQVRIYDINVDIHNLDDSLIEKKARISDNGIKTYRTVNGLYLPFSKAEYANYINKVEKDVFISANLSIKVDEGLIGVGIIIEK